MSTFIAEVEERKIEESRPRETATQTSVVPQQDKGNQATPSTRSKGLYVHLVMYENFN